MSQNVIELPAAAAALKSAYTYFGGHRIHYVEVGQGQPVLFIHGNPTSSYVWRNVMPALARETQRRCIALDLLGFGKSDKPRLRYSVWLHSQLLEAFIENLGLENPILVAEDWGGPLATFHATHHPGSVAGLALMETILWPMVYRSDLPRKFRFIFRMLRSPLGFVVIQVMNHMIKRMIPSHCPVSQESLDHYVSDYPTIASRRAMRALPKLIPINGRPRETEAFFEQFRAKLPQLRCPFVWLRASPGFIPTEDYPRSLESFARFRQLVPQLVVKEFGPGHHFLSEENPERVVELLSHWIREAIPQPAEARTVRAR